MLDTSFDLDAPRLTDPQLKQPLSTAAIDRIVETLRATLDDRAGAPNSVKESVA